MLCNIKKCNSICCKIIRRGSLNATDEQLTKAHGKFTEKYEFEGKQYLIIGKCKHLLDNGTCDRHNEEHYPNTCKSFPGRGDEKLHRFCVHLGCNRKLKKKNDNNSTKI